MIRIAGCCQPASGDRIVGYVSRGRGIIVHRADCPNVRHIPDIQERHVEVQWETVSPKATRRFQVTARAGGNLFSEVEGALKKFHGHLIEGKLEDRRAGHPGGLLHRGAGQRRGFRQGDEEPAHRAFGGQHPHAG